MKPPRFARQPFLVLTLGAALGIVLADRMPQIPPAGYALLFLSGLLVFWRSNTIFVILLTAASFASLHNLRIHETPGRRFAQAVGPAPVAATVTGVVVQEARATSYGVAIFHLRADVVEIAGARLTPGAHIVVRWRGNPKFGDTLQLFGTLRPIAEARNPGEFDMRPFLARQDIHRELQVRSPENGLVLKTPRWTIVEAAGAARSWMQSVLSRDLHDSPAVRDLISGVALGLSHQTEADIEELFQQTGTFHLFAVSGLNVAIVAELLRLLLSLVRVPRRWIVLIIIPALAFYAAVTGFQTSCVRAAIMSSVLLCGAVVERRVYPFNSLAAAAFLILALNTHQLFSIGFQLSFAVVAAILILHDPLVNALRRWTGPDPFLPRTLFSRVQRGIDSSRNFVLRAVAVSVAAWIGSTPLVLYYFHLLTPVSVLANLVVVPLAFGTLALALLSIITAPLPWFSIIFNNVNWLVAHATLASVEFFAGLPGSYLYLRHPPYPPRGTVELTVLDYRAGGALHLHEQGRHWLFDCAREASFDRSLRQYLRARGVRHVGGLLLTHGDSLHLGAAPFVLADFRPHLVIDNGGGSRSPVQQRVRKLARQHSTWRRALAGQEMQLSPGVRAKFLHPPPAWRPAATDDEAVVTLLTVGGRHRVLLMSDSGVVTEEMLLRDYPNELACDVLIKGQHRSGVSGSPKFLQAAQPDLVITSAHPVPLTQLPDAAFLQEIEKRKIKLLRQDETGAVFLRLTADYWEASAFLSAETFRSSRR